MPPPNVIHLPSEPVAPELEAARAELGTWHDINAIINSGRMPPTEWPKAKAVLELLDKHTTAAQAKVDSFLPVEIKEPTELQRVLAERAAREAGEDDNDGNQTPDPDTAVIPDLGKETH